jgi:hypothetical protein
MINMATARDHLSDTGENPYDEPSDVTANPDDYGGPYTDMISAQKQMVTLLTRIADFSEAQRESPRETQVFLSTVPYSTTIAMRTDLIVISVSAACTVGLVIGSGTQFTFNFSGADTRVIPYITAIGAGVDMSITVSAGTGTAYLVAYPVG